MTEKKALGNWGELFAKQYLLKKGYKFITSNYKAGRAELDLIFFKNNRPIFIEVKTRTKNSDSLQDIVLSRRQALTLKKAMAFYCRASRVDFEQSRLDLIVVFVDKQARLADLKHYIDII